MTTSSSHAPLVFFRVLANQTGAPAGLLMDIGPGTAADILPLFDTESFLALSGEMP